MCIESISGGNGYLRRANTDAVATIAPSSGAVRSRKQHYRQVNEGDYFWLDRSATADVSLYFLNPKTRKFTATLSGVDYHDELEWHKPVGAHPLTEDEKTIQRLQLCIKATSKDIGGNEDNVIEFPGANENVRRRIPMVLRNFKSQKVLGISINVHGKRVGLVPIKQMSDSDKAFSVDIAAASFGLVGSDSEPLPVDLIVIFSNRPPQKRRIFLLGMKSTEEGISNLILELPKQTSWDDTCVLAANKIEAIGSSAELLASLRERFAADDAGMAFESIRNAQCGSFLMEQLGDENGMSVDELWTFLSPPKKN